MAKTDIKWIAATAVAATVCACLALILIRKMSASFAQAKDEVARKRAQVGDAFTRAEDEAVHGLDEAKSDISRAGRQLHVPALPFRRARPAD
jgi:hypothetical protein